MTLVDAVKIWPTATSRDWKDTPGMSTKRGERENGRVDMLPRAVYFYGQQNQESNNTNTNHQELLNPDFVEILMGFPQGWTDCEH